MDQAQNRQNIRRPAQGRSMQMQKMPHPPQQRKRTSPPPQKKPKLHVHRQQLGGGAPVPRRIPALSKNPAQGRAPAQRVSHPKTRPVQNRQMPIQKKKRTVSRNFILATLFAILILMTIIISGVQSCAANREADGAVTTAPQKIVENDGGQPAAEEEQENALPTFAAYTDATEDLVIDSEYGILIDLESNTVVASKNGDSRIYPASMTKLMTLIVAYEHIEDLDATYTFPAEIFDALYEANASVAGFKPGEAVPFRDLFYGTALPSGADATTALALTVAGSETAFAQLMNETAQRLGLKNTHFVNASGLHDDNHYSTCHEIAIILEYAISIPELRQILGTYTYTTTPTEQNPEGLELHSTLYSKMEGSEAEGMYIQGGKTGYTLEARHCLATFAAPCTEENAPYTRPRFVLVTAYGWSEYKPIFDAINTYAKYKP